MRPKLAAVVVTYNRKQLLQQCINALLAQTAPLDRIFIIDNASTDGTEALLASPRYRNEPRIECVRLPENVGGAGGFAAGLGHAHTWGADFTWVMDDDATPDAHALQALLPHAKPGFIPVSVQVGHNGQLYGAFKRLIPRVEAIDLKDGFGRTESCFFAFVGPLLSRQCVERIGFPRTDFFISADDAEYALRARRSAFRIVIVEASRIFHDHGGGLVRRTLLWHQYLRADQPSWRCYYDTRNAIVLMLKYSDAPAWRFSAVGKILLRSIVADCLFEPRRAVQRAGYRLRGAFDALTNRMGKRVTPRPTVRREATHVA